jgi:hypothetical protein
LIGEPIANLLTLAVTLSMAPAQDTRRHNNAIHDYRYDRWFAPQRSELLLRHSLTILRGCLDASDTVRQAFEDN